MALTPTEIEELEVRACLISNEKLQPPNPSMDQLIRKLKNEGYDSISTPEKR